MAPLSNDSLPIKSLQKWGAALLGCSCALIIAGLMIVLIAAVGSERYGCEAPLENASVVPLGDRGSVVELAKSQLGKPYKWGGGCGGDECKNYPEGFASYDCSGFTAWVYYWATGGTIKLSHNSYEQRNQCVLIPRNEARPGDLVFFRNGGHVGIYIGDGKYIHAPHTGDVIKISNLGATNEFRRPKGLTSTTSPTNNY